MRRKLTTGPEADFFIENYEALLKESGFNEASVDALSAHIMEIILLQLPVGELPCTPAYLGTDPIRPHYSMYEFYTYALYVNYTCNGTNVHVNVICNLIQFDESMVIAA